MAQKQEDLNAKHTIMVSAIIFIFIITIIGGAFGLYLASYVPYISADFSSDNISGDFVLNSENDSPLSRVVDFQDFNGKSVNTIHNDFYEHKFCKKLKNDSTSFYNGFDGLTSINDNTKTITIVCSGTKGRANVKLKNISNTNFYNKNATITVKNIDENKVIDKYNQKLENTALIKLRELNKKSAYMIIINYKN